jgi:hypothetical protein
MNSLTTAVANTGILSYYFQWDRPKIMGSVPYALGTPMMHENICRGFCQLNGAIVV